MLKIKVYLTDIKIEDESYDNPWHSAFSAMWTSEAGKQFVGCPFGLGETKGDAVSDLIRRTSDESSVEIELVKVLNPFK